MNKKFKKFQIDNVQFLFIEIFLFFFNEYSNRVRITNLTPIVASAFILKKHFNRNIGFTQSVKEINILLRGLQIGRTLNELINAAELHQEEIKNKQKTKKEDKKEKTIAKNGPRDEHPKGRKPRARKEEKQHKGKNSAKKSKQTKIELRSMEKNPRYNLRKRN